MIIEQYDQNVYLNIHPIANMHSGINTIVL